MLGLSDAQFGVLVAAVLSVGGGFVGLVRWIVGIWREEKKAQRDREDKKQEIDRADRKSEHDERRQDRADDRAAMKLVADAMNAMTTEVREFKAKLNGMAEDFEEITGVHSRAPKKSRARTEPMGNPVVR